VLGTGERVPTQLFNGYAEFVAHLYDGLEGERLFA
jgi:sulfoxide reductase catalytic subunit YedY